MSRIKLITDSTSDIPEGLIGDLDIEILSIPIAVNGKEHFERVDFTSEEFYQILLDSKEIPVTAHINAATYLDAYRRAAGEGADDLINVTINAKGSSTYDAARLAAEMFRKQEPDSKMNIHVLDSRAYSMAYGHIVLEAAKMARDGAQAADIVTHIHDWLDSAEIYLCCFTLDFAKRSGRISSAAAFVGEMLGLRPIIRMVDGNNDVIRKIRGDKNVIATMCGICCEAMAQGGEYCVMKGMLDEPADDLAAQMLEQLGYPPTGIYHLGPSVSINAGPKAVGVVVRGKKRAAGR